MGHHKRRWSVIYEGDVGSAGEWCQIQLHTSCDVPAPLNHLKTTVHLVFHLWTLRYSLEASMIFGVSVKNAETKTSRKGTRFKTKNSSVITLLRSSY